MLRSQGTSGGLLRIRPLESLYQVEGNFFPFERLKFSNKTMLDGDGDDDRYSKQSD